MNQNNFEWTPDFWQGWRESENPYRQYKSRRDRRLVLETLELHDGERVLEVGFGYGWISQCLWRAAKIEWFGVDRSAAMACHLLQELDSNANDKRVALADASLPALSRTASSTRSYVPVYLMHITDTDLAVRELVRVLRHGGRMVCSINNSLSPYSFPVRIWNRRKKGFVQKFRIPRRSANYSMKRAWRLMGSEVTVLSRRCHLDRASTNFLHHAAYSSIHKVDEWVTKRFPWFAYEIWFSGVKAARP